jgi:predicted nucleic acid-binding protein
MILFWDTSAVLAVVFREIHTPAALAANRVASRSYAWSWLRVEAEAALARRTATGEQWETLIRVLNAIRYVDMAADRLDELCKLNRVWRLRAGDAGHLYCCAEASKVVPGMQLVTFDDEMIRVARRLNLRIWESGGSGLPEDRVKERRATFRVGGRKPKSHS